MNNLWLYDVGGPANYTGDANALTAVHHDLLGLRLFNGVRNDSD